jgi:hypothetical protein
VVLEVWGAAVEDWDKVDWAREGLDREDWGRAARIRVAVWAVAWAVVWVARVVEAASDPVA